MSIGICIVFFLLRPKHLKVKDSNRHTVISTCMAASYWPLCLSLPLQVLLMFQKHFLKYIQAENMKKIKVQTPWNESKSLKSLLEKWTRPTSAVPFPPTLLTQKYSTYRSTTSASLTRGSTTTRALIAPPPTDVNAFLSKKGRLGLIYVTYCLYCTSALKTLNTWSFLAKMVKKTAKLSDFLKRYSMSY